MEDHRIDTLEKKLEDQETRMRKLEVAQGETTQRLTSIEGKLDRLISMDEKLEQRFQEKEACKMVRENVRADVNALAEKTRDNRDAAEAAHEAVRAHEKYHWGKADKVVSYVTLVLIIGYLGGKVLKFF